MSKRKYEGDTFTGRKYWEDEEGNREYEGETFTGRKYREDSEGNRTYDGETFTGRKYREAPDGSREYAGETFTGRKYWEDERGNRTYEGETFTGRRYEEKEESGSCILTTACVEFANLPDDCLELNTMRQFRDAYIAAIPYGGEILKEYYRLAPIIVQRLRRDPDHAARFAYLLSRLRAAVELIEEGSNQEALRLCLQEFDVLKSRYYRKSMASYQPVGGGG